ncbi:MAG: hypothetical protein ACI37O_01845 [Candidatus Avelusimicrobium sp.]|uniref:hypothetical protein n=1 Tax=Candidatus Avelusimicrobium sp. TaxID=3048833 RepID=UPI003EFC4407
MNKEEILDFLKKKGMELAREKVQAFLETQTEESEGQEAVQPEIVDTSKYEDGDAFEMQVNQDLQDMSRDLTPEKMLLFVGRLTKMAFDVQKFCEVQENKRTLINAQREVMVQKIQAQKELMLTYLEKSFDERKTNFAKLFNLVDEAMATNNDRQLDLALRSINMLAASSPFKALCSVEETKKALEDKNYEWDF